jgi:ABC-2 type transport system permease protein
VTSLRAYPGLVRAAVQTSLVYRGRMLLWLITGFFPLLLLAVWLTVAEGNGAPAGWTTADFASYYVGATMMWQLSGDHVVWEWDADMRSGDLSTRLLRPVHPFHQYAAASIGQRIVMLSLLLPILVVAVAAVPALSYDLAPWRISLVLAAVAIAYALALVMALTVGLFGFWSTQTTNIWMMWWGLGSFASGWVAPLDLMPEWLRRIAVVLPFRTALGFPVELLAGRLDRGEIALGFAIGCAWTATFAALYVAGWRRGVRRYQAVAG